MLEKKKLALLPMEKFASSCNSASTAGLPVMLELSERGKACLV
jgi:hypothetical protein